MEISQIIEKVIEDESDLIGPVALRKAQEVEGLEVDEDGNVQSIDGDGNEVLDRVLEAYKGVVGEQAIEATKREVREEIDGEPPEALK